MSASPPATDLPRVVIDVEKIRHLNTGLGRFCLHVAEEIARQAEGLFRPVFFLPPDTARLFPAGGFDVLPLTRWRKEGIVRFVRPLLRPLFRGGEPRLWHMTHQAAKYFPLDPRHARDAHDSRPQLSSGGGPVAEPSRARKRAAVQRRIDRATVLTAVSQFTADEVRCHLDVQGKPVHVVPNGLYRGRRRRPASGQAFLPDGRFSSPWATCCRTRFQAPPRASWNGFPARGWSWPARNRRPQEQRWNRPSRTAACGAV